jgi:hypothetical protein
MRTTAWVLSLVAMTFAAGAASADRHDDSGESSENRGSTFSLAFTIGEGMVFYDGDVYRGPVTLELVPSFGWSWFKFDLGLYSTLESIRIEGTNVGYWNFTFRPGGRVTPPFLPLYFRFAFPLQLQRNNFDYGVMFGLGLDIRIVAFFGIVFEIDTTLTKDLEWGGRGVPLEFRGGVSFSF